VIDWVIEERLFEAGYALDEPGAALAR